MKKTWKVFLTLVTALVAVMLVACGQGTASKDKKEAEVKKIDFILDWTPNTNHTGLYVAKEKGYFKEAGVDVDLKLPPEESSSDLVINGKAPFAIYFQDYMAKKLEKGAGITAVAAIVEHNTSGIISRKSDNVSSPKDLVGKKYGTWNDPTELAMLKTLVESQGGDFEKVEKVPNNDSNSITPIANGVFDTAWIYYGWDGILAKSQGVDANFMYLKDYVKEFDYYSPVIIANNDYLKDNKEEARKVIQAIKKATNMPWNIQKKQQISSLRTHLNSRKSVILSSNLKNTCQKNMQATRKNGDNLTLTAGMPSTNGIKNMVSSKKT